MKESQSAVCVPSECSTTERGNTASVDESQNLVEWKALFAATAKKQRSRSWCDETVRTKPEKCDACRASPFFCACVPQKLLVWFVLLSVEVSSVSCNRGKTATGTFHPREICSPYAATHSAETDDTHSLPFFFGPCAKNENPHNDARASYVRRRPSFLSLLSPRSALSRLRKLG